MLIVEFTNRFGKNVEIFLTNNRSYSIFVDDKIVQRDITEHDVMRWFANSNHHNVDEFVNRFTMIREYGPVYLARNNGAPIEGGGQWVLRAPDGTAFDRDRFQCDLIDRWKNDIEASRIAINESEKSTSSPYSRFTKDSDHPTGWGQFFLVRPGGICDLTNNPYIPTAVQFVDGKLYTSTDEIEPIMWTKGDSIENGQTDNAYEAILEWCPLP